MGTTTIAAIAIAPALVAATSRKPQAAPDIVHVAAGHRDQTQTPPQPPLPGGTLTPKDQPAPQAPVNGLEQFGIAFGILLLLFVGFMVCRPIMGSTPPKGV